MYALHARGKFVPAGITTLAVIISFGTAHAGITVLYAFGGGNDGAYPAAGVVEDKAGNLFGTTGLGGGNYCSPNPGCGTVFKLAPDGTETVLHAFTAGKDGAFPAGLIEDRAGNLYGTTNSGGGAYCDNLGCGTVFKVTPDGTETVLYSFAGGNDGEFPFGGLVLDEAGNIYGTTQDGGEAHCDGNSCGTVYKVAPNGTETVLYIFRGGNDGYLPVSGLIRDKAGNLYGATMFGGQRAAGCDNGCGTVFKLAPDGTETVLYAFNGGSDGAFPTGGPMKGNAGDLYGATGYGGGTGCGGEGCGTVFKLAPDGKETVLHAFASGNDGAAPDAGLIQDKAGNLYGTTYSGGAGCTFIYGCGTIFKLAPDGTETVLYAFGKDHQNGTYPNNLLKGAGGRFYGTANSGGSGYGTVFRFRK